MSEAEIKATLEGDKITKKNSINAVEEKPLILHNDNVSKKSSCCICIAKLLGHISFILDTFVTSIIGTILCICIWNLYTIWANCDNWNDDNICDVIQHHHDYHQIRIPCSCAIQWTPTNTTYVGQCECEGYTRNEYLNMVGYGFAFFIDLLYSIPHLAVIAISFLCVILFYVGFVLWILYVIIWIVLWILLSICMIDASQIPTPCAVIESVLDDNACDGTINAILFMFAGLIVAPFVPFAVFIWQIDKVEEIYVWMILDAGFFCSILVRLAAIACGAVYLYNYPNLDCGCTGYGDNAFLEWPDDRWRDWLPVSRLFVFIYIGVQAFVLISRRIIWIFIKCSGDSPQDAVFKYHHAIKNTASQ